METMMARYLEKAFRSELSIPRRPVPVSVTSAENRLTKTAQGSCGLEKCWMARVIQRGRSLVRVQWREAYCRETATLAMETMMARYLEKAFRSELSIPRRPVPVSVTSDEDRLTKTAQGSCGLEKCWMARVIQRGRSLVTVPPATEKVLGLTARVKMKLAHPRHRHPIHYSDL
jgi:hypothetical protein